MSSRTVEKAKTREKIIKATEFLIRAEGFVKISSKKIATECGVSQGSIFLHFGTKDRLLMTILDSNIDNLEESLKAKCKSDLSSDTFLKNYVEVFAEYEDILSRIYRDYSYLDNDLQKKVDGLEVYLKNLIFDNYKKNASKKMSIVDSFIAIDAFLSQTKDYLMAKETFTTSNSVTRQKRGKLVKLYRMLFN